jgi:hypothetical protein
VAIAHHLRVLHVTYAVEQLEEITLGRVERQVPDVKTGRCDFDRFRPTRRTLRTFLRRAVGWLRRPRLLLLWL